MRLCHLTLTSALTCAALAAPAGASAAPAVTASGPATAERGVELQLDLGSSGFRKIACGLGYSVDWENDGTWDSTASVFWPHTSHTYATLGPRTIALKAETGGGSWNGCDPAEVATTTTAVTVVNAAPRVEIGCLGAAETGTPVTCATDVAQDPDGAIARLEWDVDGDGFDDGTGDEVSTTFATAGDKTVRLRATDDAGATTVASTVVEVYAPAAGAPFAVSAASVVRGQRVTFTAPAGADEGDKEYERRWDVDGDGDWDDVSTGRTLTRSYAAAGTYTVRLRVQQVGGDPRGATLATRTVTVTEPRADGGGDQAVVPAPMPPAPAAPSVTPRAATPPAVGTTTASKAAPRTTTKKAAAKRTCRTVKAKKGRKVRKVCKAAKKRAARKARR